MKTLQSFVLLLFFTVCHNITTGVYSQCLRDQQLSLLHLKKNLTFYDDGSPVSSKFVSWDSSTDCCSWVGVTCSGNGRVVGLDISSQRISGGIDSSSSLFDLQHLQSLNLADNSFVEGSRIPSAIGKLTNLRYLNLSTNVYFGKIPIGISRLTKLEVLDISQSYYNEDQPLESPKFSMLFQNLTELTELHLDGVDVSAEGTHWCQAISSSLPNLRVLSLNGANLSGPIDRSLAKLQSLSVILLGGYPGYISGPIPEFFSNFSNLTVLNLDGNNISGPIPEFFSNFSNLTVLNLDGNNISAPVPGFFANFSKLTTLSLRGCGLRGTFPKQIFQVPTLQTIDLSSNTELHVSLPEFPKNGSLRSLILSWTSFSGLLHDSIGNLNMLSTLDLSGCNFTGSIPMSIGNLTKLVDLYLSSNMFNGPISSIHWENLINLAYLNLNDNQLVGSIPSCLFSLPLLGTLELSLNYFAGRVPEIFNVSSSFVTSIDLSFNHLEGPVPVSIFNFRWLETLTLSSNNFSAFPFNGPHQLPNQTYLTGLDLSENQIQGQLPNWIWKLDSLYDLNVSYNALESLEGSSINSTSHVCRLDLHSNQLKGPISIVPPNAEYLDYSDNHFSSSIPVSICNASDLGILDLSSNSLSGEIPQCLVAMRGLQVLNVRKNNIAGTISNLEFPENCGPLETLDLSQNQIKGQLPKSLARCRSLSFLNLEENRITDTFPCLLKNISTLSVLLLRSNNFYGSIGCPVVKTNGTWPILALDLSSNSLSGEIPQCLAAMSTLVMLNVRKNNISGMISNLEFPENCESLEALDLSQNQIEGQFPKSLARCRSLVFLNLEGNQITDTFPCLLKNISTLRVLALRSNNFYGGIGCPVVKTNATWPVLQIVDLAYNNFDGEVPGFSLTTWQAMKDNTDLSTKIGFPLTIQVSRNPYKRRNHRFGEVGSALNKGVVFYEHLIISYEPAITITSKGLKWDLAKIPTILTLIDFSFNNFSGPIPKEMGDLKSLYFLNLSSNAFTGEIPSSFGNMRQLESLDLSQNKLSGQIPQQLAKLNFLAFLNLSNNRLVGKIPASTQISTFPRDSFTGNKGLWGPPLTVDNKARPSPPPTSNGSHPNSTYEIDWDLISVEIGFVLGFAVAVGSLVFFKRWSKWYYRSMYKILVRIFPQLEERIGPHRRHVHINQRWRR